MVEVNDFSEIKAVNAKNTFSRGYPIQNKKIFDFPFSMLRESPRLYVFRLFKYPKIIPRVYSKHWAMILVSRTTRVKWECHISISQKRYSNMLSIPNQVWNLHFFSFLNDTMLKDLWRKKYSFESFAIWVGWFASLSNESMGARFQSSSVFGKEYTSHYFISGTPPLVVPPLVFWKLLENLLPQKLLVQTSIGKCES